jgi:opacity protein-like surface antigen
VSIERPLSSAAAVSGVASARVNEGRLSGYIRTTTRISDLYGRNNVSGSSIGGGVAWQLSPNTTLNLDYSARDIYGPGAEPEQEVFFGIKIRF